MNIFNRAVLIFLLAILFTRAGLCQSNDYNPARLYPANELKKDFQFLRTALEKTHPNLYLYTPLTEFNLFFDSLYKSIGNPLTAMEFYNLITLLNSKIQDGHTLFLPGQDELNYYNQRGKFLPLYVAISGDRLYADMNCSPDTLIKEGTELLSINGIKAAAIINQLLIRQIRDGHNKTYPSWILTNYFKEYFGFLYGHPDSFAITYKTEHTNRQVTVNALSKDSIKYYRQARYSNRVSFINEKQGIIFRINKQLHAAILSIKSFDNDLLESVYKQDFDSTIKKVFHQIDSAHISSLILDIRNNQGGDFEPGKLLLSYLVRHPVTYLPGNKKQEIISPRKNNFKGDLFILTNGGSFSSTAIVCSYLEFTKRGIFIGDETAGNKVIISGDPVDIILPNTKILAEISTVKYVIRHDRNYGRGIIPDYYKIPVIDDIISDKDPAMEFALELIQKER